MGAAKSKSGVRQNTQQHIAVPNYTTNPAGSYQYASNVNYGGYHPTSAVSSGYHPAATPVGSGYHPAPISNQYRPPATPVSSGYHQQPLAVSSGYHPSPTAAVSSGYHPPPPTAAVGRGYHPTSVSTGYHTAKPTGSANTPTTTANNDTDYITAEDESWYFGKIDINRCVKLLGDDSVAEGTFIVRDSTSASGTVCISVKGRSSTGQAIFSVRIRKKEDGRGGKQYVSAIDNNVFPSLQDVIRYYKENGIHAKGYSVPLRGGLQNQHYYLGEGEESDPASFEIKEKDIQLQEELGRGFFGSVLRGTWKKQNGQVVDVAIKKLHCDKKAEVDKFEKEANLMKMVYHDNIVTLIGVCNEKYPMIITELMSRGDLLKYLKSKDEEKPLKDLYYFADQVASGMKFMASKNIVHRDLAARNVLLGEQHIVKIADFGLSRIMDEDEGIYISTAVALPVKWTAPEGLEPPRTFSTKSDVWSYGIFLTELITRGKSPYPSINIKFITKSRLVDQGFRMTKDVLGSDCSESLYALMQKCWQSDPDQRPDFETVYQEIHKLYEPFVPIRHC